LIIPTAPPPESWVRENTHSSLKLRMLLHFGLVVTKMATVSFATRLTALFYLRKIDERMNGMEAEAGGRGRLGNLQLKRESGEGN